MALEGVLAMLEGVLVTLEEEFVILKPVSYLGEFYFAWTNAANYFIKETKGPYGLLLCLHWSARTWSARTWILLGSPRVLQNPPRGSHNNAPVIRNYLHVFCIGKLG